MTARTTSYLPLSSLQANPANPKSHDTSTIDASINRFGVVESIVRDDRTGYIISGHGRAETLRAMRDRGEDPPEGIQLAAAPTDHEGHALADSEWLVPVTTGWASRTDTEATAALIALNRTTEHGGWIDTALLDALDALTDSSPDGSGLTGVGFDSEDIDALRRLLDETDALPAPTPPDEFPAFDSDIETTYQCPSCGYEWSGSPAPGHAGA